MSQSVSQLLSLPKPLSFVSLSVLAKPFVRILVRVSANIPASIPVHAFVFVWAFLRFLSKLLSVFLSMSLSVSNPLARSNSPLSLSVSKPTCYLSLLFVLLVVCQPVSQPLPKQASLSVLPKHWFGFLSSSLTVSNPLARSNRHLSLSITQPLWVHYRSLCSCSCPCLSQCLSLSPSQAIVFVFCLS